MRCNWLYCEYRPDSADISVILLRCSNEVLVNSIPHQLRSRSGNMNLTSLTDYFDYNPRILLRKKPVCNPLYLSTIQSPANDLIPHFHKKKPQASYSLPPSTCYKMPSPSPSISFTIAQRSSRSS